MRSLDFAVRPCVHKEFTPRRRCSPALADGDPLMKLSVYFTAALLAGAAFALPALAAVPNELSPAETTWHEQASAKRLQLTPLRAAAPGSVGVLAPKVMGNATYPGTPMANGFRAYPPSCAADPLPDKASGTIWSGNVPLFARTSSGQAYTETATITVWRLACSSSGAALPYNPTGAFNALTLMRIDRSQAAEGDHSKWPYLPLIQAAQGSITDFGTDPKTLIRVATEPNTVIAEMPYGTPMYDSTTFVLENYPYVDAGYFTYSDAFTLRINPLLNNVAPLDLAIPAYNPSESTYPDAFAALPLDGYAAAQWQNFEFDEGLLVQVAEGYDSANPNRRMLIFDLLTHDAGGAPIWLIGSAAFDSPASGTTSLTPDVYYLGNHQAGGGFQMFHWGKAKFVMASCGELQVTYTPDANLPGDVPSFSGLTSYERIFSANGMVCE